MAMLLQLASLSSMLARENTITNSSPPIRANLSLRCSTLPMRSATCFSTLSPAVCPYRSLMSFKRQAAQVQAARQRVVAGQVLQALRGQHAFCDVLQGAFDGVAIHRRRIDGKPARLPTARQQGLPLQG